MSEMTISKAFISWTWFYQKPWFIKWLLWCASSLCRYQDFQRTQDNLVGTQARLLIMATRSNAQFLAASVTEFMTVWAMSGEASLNLFYNWRYHHHRLQLHPWKTGCSPLPASLYSFPPSLLSLSQASPQRACREGEKPPQSCSSPGSSDCKECFFRPQ